MTQEVLKTMKEEYINYIKEFMRDYGQLQTMITVFADVNGEEKPGVIHIPVPGQYMKNEQSKDEFVDEVVPEIFSSIKERFTPHALAWTSVAWVRQTTEKEQVKDYKKLPIKKEVVFISFQEKDSSNCVVFDIIRGEKQVTRSGDIVDRVELQQDFSLDHAEGMEGRFSNLFSKFDD